LNRNDKVCEYEGCNAVFLNEDGRKYCPRHSEIRRRETKIAHYRKVQNPKRIARQTLLKIEIRPKCATCKADLSEHSLKKIYCKRCAYEKNLADSKVYRYRNKIRKTFKQVNNKGMGVYLG
jgi:hypothetical protein